MSLEDLIRRLRSDPSIPWRAASNGTHILSRDGFELGRFSAPGNAGLAVCAVNAACDMAARIETLELNLSIARAALADTQERLRDADGERGSWAEPARRLLDALEGMVAQHCGGGDGLDSMAISANCEAMEVLADMGRVVLDGASVGRRAIGRWPAPTPEEEAAKVADTEAENARRDAEPPRDWQAERDAHYDRGALHVEPFVDGRFLLCLRQPEGGGESAFGGPSPDTIIVLADGTEVPLAGGKLCPKCT